MAKSAHVRSMSEAETVYEGELGSIKKLTADNFGILKRMSMQKVVLAPGAIREPHWHVNANELAYCISGTILVSLLDTGDGFASFTITAGQMFHIDVGSLNAIENIGNEPAELVIVYGHEKPEDFALRGAFGAMSSAVLGNTYDLPAAEFDPILKDMRPAYLIKRDGPPTVPDTAGLPDKHKFDIEAMSPPVDFPYGTARTARNQFWPILKDLSMYVIHVSDNGMREPHWHPNTAEMGYVHVGRARMTIMDPDGSCDTYILEAGDAYFIPRSYPHQIEVLGDEPIHFCIFFDQPFPADVGYRAAATAFSSELLSATFGVAKKDLPAFPFTPIDPLIVGKLNPSDPVVA